MVNPSKVIDAEYFKDRCTVNEATGCHEWTRHLNPGGYGTLKHKRKQQMAHRAAWEFWRGPIPAGMIVCHRCDNRRCINPDHLFIGTTQDNVDDKMAKGRFRPCRGERSGTSKLTESEIMAIRLDNRPQSTIAADYGISQSNVSIIKQGKTWAEIAAPVDKRMTVSELAKSFGVDYGVFRHQLCRQGRSVRQALGYCGVLV